MIISRPQSHRLARVMARAGAAASATMVAATALGMSSSHVPPAYAAATDAGPAVVINKPPDGGSVASVPLSSGGSATQFSLRLPAGAACKGDSANDNYLVQTYMVPAAVDPGTLTFDSDGPLPSGTGASFRQPLFTTTSSPAVSMLTGVATNPGDPGPVNNIPALNFAALGPGDLPAGTYNLGVACTLGPASAEQLDKFWNVRMTIVEDANDAPARIAWTVAQVDPGTTTTTTTPVATTTTTTALGATTTTTPGGTTTTTRGATTTPGGTTGTSAGGMTTASTPLSRTGGLSTSLLAWSVLLLIFGRMAVLLGRKPEVRSGGRK